MEKEQTFDNLKEIMKYTKCKKKYDVLILMTYLKS